MPTYINIYTRRESFFYSLIRPITHTY